MKFLLFNVDERMPCRDFGECSIRLGDGIVSYEWLSLIRVERLVSSNERSPVIHECTWDLPGIIDVIDRIFSWLQHEEKWNLLGREKEINTYTHTRTLSKKRIKKKTHRCCWSFFFFSSSSSDWIYANEEGRRKIKINNWGRNKFHRKYRRVI